MILERFDMSLGAGLGKLKGRIFRIGHLGDFNDLMLAGTLCGVEMGLRLARRARSSRACRRRSTLLERERCEPVAERVTRPLDGRPRPRADAGDGRAVLRPGARRHGRRRDQGRAAGRRPDAALARLPHGRRRHRGVPRRQPQQALASTLDLKDDEHARGLPPPRARRRRACSRTTARAWRRGSASTTRRSREVNPRLVYASISGFGQTGPYAQRPGYDLIAQGLAGVMSVTGEPDGNPVKCGIPIGDLSRRAVLRGRRSCPRCTRASGPAAGQYIDTSLFEGALALSIWETAELWATGPRAGQARLRAPADRALPGAAHRATATSRSAATTSGCSSALCAALGPRGPGRGRALRHQRRPDGERAELVAELEARARRARHRRVGRRRCSRRGVPCGPIHDYAEVFADPHTQAREMVVELEHPVEGTIQRARHPGEALRHARRDPARRAAARPAHRGDPARGRLRGSEIEALDVERGPARAPRARRCGSRSTAPRRTTR